MFEFKNWKKICEEKDKKIEMLEEENAMLRKTIFAMHEQKKKEEWKEAMMKKFVKVE